MGFYLSRVLAVKPCAHLTFSGVQRVEDLTTLGNASAGFFAAFFSSLTLCPTELIKCRLQAMREVQSQEAINGNKKVVSFAHNVSMVIL